MTTAGDVWQEIGAGETIFTKLLRFLILCGAALVAYFFAVLPLTWPQQAVLGLLSLLMALAMARSSDSYLVTLTLMLLSSFCTFRYGYWRITQVIDFFKIRPTTGARSMHFSSAASCWPSSTPSAFFFSDTSRPSGRCGARLCRCPTIPMNGRTSTS